jgi:hypothetical protein
MSARQMVGDLVRRPPASSADRWAHWILAVIESPADLRTVTALAKFLGVSETTFGEACRLLDVRPHDARDLARMLRVVSVSGRDEVHWEGLIDVSDRRTLKKILGRSGLSGLARGAFSAEAFLEHQCFVHADNQGLRVLKRLLAK